MPRGSRPKDEIVFAVAERFIRHGKGAVAISRWLAEDRHVIYGREDIYPLVHEAVRRGYVTLAAPRRERLEERISDRYRKPRSRIRVVDVVGPSASENTAFEGADLALDLIRDLGRRGGPVHIGLGAGYTTMRFAQRLAHLLRFDDECPDLVLHAITSGFSVEEPQIAPVSFFSLFHDSRVKVDSVGLFAPAVVSCSEYERVKQFRGVAESFARAGEIQIVVTSFGSVLDDHGQLTSFMKHSAKGRAALVRAGWVGDVMYRPYSRTRPITEDTDIRATTLFEPRDLGMLAHAEGKHVILIAGPCGGCGKSRPEALRPLLEEPALETWNHLVTDVTTAERLLD